VDSTPFPDEALSCDHLLGGRVRLWQPRRGYRAATDPVLLAAACPARPGERVLDLGCGVGTAGLCLAARVGGLELHGLEIQPAYAALAERNARENGVAATIHIGDVAAVPRALRALVFDHVIANPPWFETGASASPEVGRDRARRIGAADTMAWVASGLRRLRQGGWLTLIHRTEALPDILAACRGRAGAIAVRPLAARDGRAAGRILLRARKDSAAPFRLCAPFVLHEGERHGADGDDFTAAARAVLRDGGAIGFDGT
jgi:tRNA1(Val) A37 N6-methylase TrmN6